MLNISQANKIQTECISCNKLQLHDEYIQKGLDTSFKSIICKGCGLRSIYPLPIHVSSGDTYKDTKGVAKTTDNDLISFLRKLWRNARLKPVRDQLIKYLPAGRVLEMGAGDGTLIRLIKNEDGKNNYKISALELSGTDYHCLKEKGIDVQQCTLEQASFPEKSYDAVLATHVFEHIPNVVEVFTEIRRILKPGGLLIASVPSESALSMKLGVRRMWRNLGIRGHIYSYNKDNFAALFANCGFNVMSAKDMMIPQVVIVGVNREESA